MQTCDVLVSGCFNVMHPGHVRLFEFATRFGQVTVGVNADRYVQSKYGEYAIPLVSRVYVLKSSRFIHNVIVFDEDEPSKLILRLKPRYYVRGPDYAGLEIPEQAALDQIGTRLIIHREEKEHDSSHLVKSIPSEVLAKLAKYSD